MKTPFQTIPGPHGHDAWSAPWFSSLSDWPTIRPAIRRKGLRGLPQFFRRFDSLRSEKIGSPARRIAAATRSLTPLAYSVGSFRQFTKGDHHDQSLRRMR